MDRRDGTYENFKEWAVKQFGHEDLDSGDETEVPVHRQKAKNIVFERNKHGEFVLPPAENFNMVKQKQRVIQGYIGAFYR